MATAKEFKKVVGSGKVGSMSSPKALFTGKPSTKKETKPVGKGGCK